MSQHTPVTAKALKEAQIPLAGTPDVLLTPEEIAEEHRKQQAAQLARIEAARATDPLTFLPAYQATKINEFYYRRGAAVYITDHSPTCTTITAGRYGTIHIAGQALLHAAVEQFIFTLDELQDGFNNVSIQAHLGATPEREDLLTRTVMAMTAEAWEQSIRAALDIPEVVNAYFKEQLGNEGNRLPAQIDGKPFQALRPAFEPSAGRFNVCGALALEYYNEGDEANAVQFLITMRDLREANVLATDAGFAARVYLEDLSNLRNIQVERYMTNAVPNILARVANTVGPEILKGPIPVSLDPGLSDDEAAQELSLAEDIENGG